MASSLLLDELANGIAGKLLGDLCAIWRAAQECLDHVSCLLEAYLGWQWRLIGIDCRLDQRGSGLREGFAQDGPALPRVTYSVPTHAARPRNGGIVDRMQFAAIFRIAQERHLL